MNNFSVAMQNVVSPNTTTANNLPAYSQSNSALVDLYYRMVRNISKEDLTELLHKAWQCNPLGTVKLIFQARDCRGGKGDKDSFKLAFDWLTQHHIDTAAVNLHLLPEYGYWKDLIQYFKSESTDLAILAVTIYKQALESDNRLAFKYAPRTGKSLDWASKILRKSLGLTEQTYRKFLKKGTTVVESQMCANEWDEIKYSSVPSKAHKNYKAAFGKHTEERYNQYLAEVAEGKTNIKASQLYPYELLKEYENYSPQNQTTDLQWAELVNKVKASGMLSAALPVIDVSGSMCTEVAKGVEAIEISKALGLLISEVVAPPWNNLLINFSKKPIFFELESKTLFYRYQELKAFERHEGYDTNFLAVFQLILARAKDHKLSQEDLPKMIIALSDCQFNDSYLDNNKSAQQIIKDLYQAEGYIPPVLVFWNLNGSYNNFPATSQEGNVILLSGFSPSALTYLLTKGLITPEAIVLDIINSPRYAAITVG